MRSTELVARMRLDSSQFDRSLQQSQSSLRSFASVASAVPGGRGSMLGSLADDAARLVPAIGSLPLGIAAVGASMLALGVSAQRAGSQVESGLAQIRTLGKDAQDNIGAVRDALYDTRGSLPITESLREVASANYELQSSGRTAAESIQDTRVAAEASIAGFTNMRTSVDGLTTATNAWRDTGLTSAQASDIFFTAVARGKVRFEELAGSIGLVAPIASSMGVSFQETAGAAAVLSLQGVRTTQAMEGIRSALINVQSPTESFKKDFPELAQAFDSTRLARDGFLKFLTDFDKQSGGSRTALRALFSDTTAFSTVLGLLKNDGAEYADVLRSMATAAGETQRALAEVTNTSEAQEQLIRNRLSNEWSKFGELLNDGILPVLKFVAEMLHEVNTAAGGLRTLGADAGRAADAATLYSGVDVKGVLRESTRFMFRLPPSRPTQTGFVPVRDVPSAVRRPGAGGIGGGFGDEISSQFRGAFSLTGALAGEADLLRGGGMADLFKKKPPPTGTGTSAKAQRDRIVRDANALIEQLQAKAIEALQGTEGALRAAMEKTLQEGSAMLRSKLLSPEARAALTAELERFEALQQELITVAAEARITDTVLADFGSKEKGVPSSKTALDDRQKELIAIREGTANLEARRQIDVQLAKIVDARKKNIDAIESVEKTGGASEIRARIRAYGDLAQAVANLGDAFGLVSGGTASALRGLGAIASQGTRIQSTFGPGSTATGFDKFSLGIQIASGVAQFAKGLFSGTPEEQQRREELKHNTDALKTLTDRVGDLASSSLSGSSLTAIRSALQSPGSFNVDGQGRIANLAGVIASRAGVSAAEVESYAETLGITLNNTFDAFAQLAAASQRADLNAYLNTFAGSLERLNATIAVDGITDPIEILRRRIATLSEPTTGFPALAAALEGIDISTVEGRTDAGARARALFDRIQSGNFALSELGGLSGPEARQQLVELITSLRETTAGSGTGGFNETRTITEVSASRLAGLLGTSNTYLATIASDMAAVRAALVVASLPAITAPSMPSGFGAGGAGVLIEGGLHIRVTIPAELFGDAAGTLAYGQRVGQLIGEQTIASIDQAMAQRRGVKKLLAGDTVLN